jgi:PKD repeat protein
MSGVDPDESWSGGGTIARNRIVRNAGAGVLVAHWPGLEVRGNRVEENGVGLQVWGDAAPRVWDNLFNNTVALDLADATAPPVLNATRSAGPNIVGGPSVGGNFWGAPDGTGFSQTHADGDGDGFVDEPFVDTSGALDHLPLAPAPAVVAVPGGAGLPADTDGDGLYEDVNGNGRADFADVVLFFDRMDWVAANEPVALFDYNANGRIDFADVVWLFNRL